MQLLTPHYTIYPSNNKRLHYIFNILKNLPFVLFPLIFLQFDFFCKKISKKRFSLINPFFPSGTYSPILIKKIHSRHEILIARP